MRLGLQIVITTIQEFNIRITDPDLRLSEISPADVRTDDSCVAEIVVKG